MMAVPIKNTMGKDITPDYSKHRDHINRLLAEIEGRKFACNEMAEVKRLKLEQTLQLRTCEKDADQVLTLFCFCFVSFSRSDRRHTFCVVICDRLFWLFR